MKIKLIVLLSLLSFALLNSCDNVIRPHEDENAIMTKSGEQGTEIENIMAFCREIADADDYCTGVETSGEGLKITAVSGKSVTYAGTIRLFRMDMKKGEVKNALLYEGRYTGIELKVRDTWYDAPSSSVSDEGTIIIDGNDTKIESHGLYAIDCGKYVYFYSKDGVVGVPSEIYGPFNPPAPRNVESLKVLFVGNSFNQDATAHLPDMLKAAGVTDKVFIARTYRGGRTVAEYLQNFETENYCFYTDMNMNRSWYDNEGSSGYDSNLKKALSAQEWDIVTFMEYSGDEECLNGWDGVSRFNNIPVADNVRNMIKTIFENTKGGARPTVMFLLTQAYGGTRVVQEKYKSLTQMEHYDKVISYGMDLYENTCIDDIISSATAIQNLRSSRFNTEAELLRDGYHLDYGLGRYTAACTMWQKIFEPALGISLEDNTHRFSQSDSKTTPVTDYNIRAARMAAKYAAEKPFEITSLSLM